MDEEILNRIADYFEPWELIQYLRSLSTRDIIDAFPDDIEDCLEAVIELMDVTPLMEVQ